MSGKKKSDDVNQAGQTAQVAELTDDLQRLRADFENYRKQAERERDMARKNGADSATTQMLPVIDNVERAIAHIPEDIADHPWVKGIGGLIKQLDSTLGQLGVKRIDANNGTAFNPEVHQAVHFDDTAEGEHEVVAEELQAGYTLHDRVIRPAMVKVTRQ